MIIRIILNSLTIRTALVAAREAFDWEASWATEDVPEVEKMRSVMKFTSKTMETVETISRKKKKERKYPSITSVLRMISIAKMDMTIRLMISKMKSTWAEKKVVRKSSEKREYSVKRVMKI